MIRLGSKVKDRITGYAGIAIGRTEWLNGCARIVVQSQNLKDGEPIGPVTFDEPDLILLKDSVIKSVEESRPGGPRPDAIRR